jgi:hypothetical protein
MGNGEKPDGLKITLGINTTMIAAAVVAVIGLYFQVQGLAEDTEEVTSLKIPARVIVLEQKIINIEKTVERNEEKLDDIQISQDKILDAVTDD